MTATGFMVAAIGVAVLGGMSLIANGRFAERAKLPMQWSLSGRVNWSAPRRVALAFTPLLAAIVLLIAMAGLSGHPGQLVALVSITLVFVAVHLLHLCLIARQTAQ